MSPLSIPEWAIGVLLAFGGCALSNFGINMFKLAHIRMAEEEARQKEIEEWGHDVDVDGKPSDVTLTLEQEEAKKAALESKTSSVVCHPVWILGASCVILGSILDLVSFAFASVSLLAPLGALTLVLNMCMAPVFLKEKLTLWDVLCTSLILSGVIVALVFGNKDNSTYSLQQLLSLYSEVAFIVFIALFGALVVLMGVFLLRSLYRLASPDVYSADTLNTDHRIVLATYPTFAGMAGSMSVLFAKSAIEMIKSALLTKSNKDLSHPAFTLFLLGTSAFIYLQCVCLNKGLERGDALFIVPVYQVSWVFMNTLVGLIYFRDFIGMTSLQVGFFGFGVSVSLFGVYLLSLRERAKNISHGFSQSATSINVDSNVVEKSRLL